MQQISKISHTNNNYHIYKLVSKEMPTKLVINRDSGNCDKLNIDALFEHFGRDCEKEFIDSRTNWNADNFDTVVVCGGDGTLYNALAKCNGKRLFYCPCGTLNETAHTEKEIRSLCQVNGEPFCYVCATGTFTEIGYSATAQNKKHHKWFAYLPEVLKNYRCREIAAQIELDDKHFCGIYTLLMVLKSHRCFGFPFNGDYKHTKKPYLLVVNSVGKNNFFNKIKLFFPFFRIFFFGAAPKVTANWLLLPFDNLQITLNEPQKFCVDGEKRILGRTLCFQTTKVDPPIEILPKVFL